MATINQANTHNGWTFEQRNEAATKIQALFRGGSIRNELLPVNLKDSECTFCLDVFKAFQRRVEFTCQAMHTFHFQCAREAAKFSGNCPLDRSEGANPIWVQAQERGTIGFNLRERNIRENIALSNFEQGAVLLSLFFELTGNLGVALTVANTRMAALSNPLQQNPDIASIARAALASIGVIFAVGTITYHVNAFVNRIIDRNPGGDLFNVVMPVVFRVLLLLDTYLIIGHYGLGE